MSGITNDFLEQLRISGGNVKELEPVKQAEGDHPTAISTNRAGDYVASELCLPKIYQLECNWLFFLALDKLSGL